MLNLKGDAEKKKGLPVTQCMDRSTNMSKTQSMFIEFIVLPTAQVNNVIHCTTNSGRQQLQHFQVLTSLWNTLVITWKCGTLLLQG